VSTVKKTKKRAVFGDFQTPLNLARRIATFVQREEPQITTVVEPTCGVGSFLRASLETFGSGKRYYGFDINPEYVQQARRTVAEIGSESVEINCQDFYRKDWRAFFRNLAPPVLVIGNPPWVTNAALGVLGGSNLPEKTNFQQHSGLAAKTGKANFDICEWMFIKLLEALQGTRSALAMLCKTSTARRVLRHAWKQQLDVGPSSVHLIDASEHFGVSVHACLLFTHTGNGRAEATATTYSDMTFVRPVRTFGLFGGELVSDIDTYRELRDVDGLQYRKWRSGVKHDAARVMEFTRQGACYVNRLGEACEIEDECLYPLLKSSDLANGRLIPSRYVLLTQRRLSDDTPHIESVAPRTWKYLLAHSKYLDHRRSAIYAKRARFSVFGIGPYTFAPWKVAISGLYKNLVFQVLGQHEGKPTIVDDTCYFIPCELHEEATFFCELLNSRVAQRFMASLVFQDAKRPVTIDILRRIDLKKVAEHLGQEEEALQYLALPGLESSHQRILVFEKNEEYRTRESIQRP